MLEMHGTDGTEWLRRVPDIVADCARRWSLALDPTPLESNYGYLAPGTRADGSPIILKVSFPEREFFTGVEALRLYDGRGCVRLCELDLSAGALLLERLVPGTMLSDLPDDEEATTIAARLMRRLWRPAPAAHSFPTIADWVLRMEEAPRLVGPDRPFPLKWSEHALGLFHELAATAAEPVLLHGDLHHYNILAAQREPWLAIDPKGVVGEPVWEVGAFVFNNLPEDLEPARTVPLLERRLTVFARELGCDRERLRAAVIARTVLSGFWSLEDSGYGWEESITVARYLAGREV